MRSSHRLEPDKPRAQCHRALGAAASTRTRAAWRVSARSCYIFLPVPLEAFASIFSTELGRAVREDYTPAILVFDPELEVIRQWLR